jgi:hypothetical protein
MEEEDIVGLFIKQEEDFNQNAEGIAARIGHKRYPKDNEKDWVEQSKLILEGIKKEFKDNTVMTVVILPEAVLLQYVKWEKNGN